MKNKRLLLLKKFIMYSFYGLVTQLILCSILMATSVTNAQKNVSVKEIKVSFNFESDNLVSVFEKIENNTNYIFTYYQKEFDKNISISGNYTNVPLYQVLLDISEKSKLSFKQFNNNITVSKLKGKDAIVVIAADIDISGKITDENGEALPGASVVVKGTTNGSTTDLDGNYKLRAPEDGVLVISYVGYVTQEIIPGSRNVIDVEMVLDEARLDEIVVVGYGTQKKANLTGAVSQVKSADFVDERPIMSVGQALQGVAPGLTITKSNGIPGEGYSFNIRGYNSLNGGSPLILVDGSEMDPNLIPPSDIASVTVLKDAASAAIYGARAAFGVVLITTKSGKKNSNMQFKYTNNISSTRPTTLPDKADPVTQIEVGGIQWENAGRTPGWYWGRNVQTWIDLYNAPDYVPNSIPVINGVAYPLGDNNNMIKLMTESSMTVRHDFSISGGSDNTTYYLGAGIMNQDGVLALDKDKYSRKNIMAKVDTDINEWLAVGTSVGFTRGIQNMPYIPNNASYMYDVSYLRPTFWLTGIDEVSGAPWGFSPAMIGLGANNTYATDNTNLQLRATVSPFEGMKINGTYTHRSITGNDSYHVNTYEQANPTDGPGVVYKYRNDPNSLRKTASFDNYDNLFLTAEYSKTISDVHNFKLMVGYSQEKSSYSSYYAQRQKLITDDVPSLSLAVGNSSVGDDITEWATRSGLYRLNYDYQGKYLLEVVGRYDGSSRFHKDNRFVFMPSASVGWVLSEESFMSGAEGWLNFLKIRVSYGSQGNQQVGAYSYIPSMSTGTANWIINGERPLYSSPGGLVSDSYTWEKVNTTNFGFDFAFFKNKLQTTAEIYKRETIGMLTAGEVLPATLGTSVPNENSSDLRVNGWELSLNWADNISSDFSYSAGLILYDDKAVITKYAGNETKYLGSIYEGQQLGEIWGYETDRLFQEDDFVDNGGTREYAEGIPTQDIIFSNRVPFPGDVKYKDLNNDGKVDYGDAYTLDDHGDYKVIGNSRSRYQYGIRLGANYKGIDLSIFLQGVAKKDYWTSGAFAFTAGSQYESVFAHTLDYWTAENTGAFYPRPDDRSYNKKPQTRYLLNAAYMRLKMIKLGYSIPKNVLSKINLESVKIYVTGENLFLFTGLPKGMDPELGASHTFPLAKDFSIGTTITF
ncbi:TonB-dependent receptor [Reichenbachiella sp. MALMAid0571]|uniref:SusC/RagA family TonB-linked outer membrane protein n=1 Tax=Reichenbachiella sp. MALMAid0571 TaxID=3143939 RepID=UPI0032DE4C01